MTQLIVHSDTLNPVQTQLIENRLLCKLESHANHYRATLNMAPTAELLNELSQALSLDLNILSEDFDASNVKLIISDMDSTLISIECVDEIADFIGVKKEVSEITEAAMRGELDFEGSLTQRVALLKGLSTDAMQTVYDERLELNPGAVELLEHTQTHGIKFALVSGGFTFFTDRLKERLGLDYTRANVLDEENNALTGKVLGGIIGAQAKQDFLHELCDELNIKPSQVIAVGDGSNDLKMMEVAGLSVAYHAKPVVQEQTHVQLNHHGLDAILDFLA